MIPTIIGICVAIIAVVATMIVVALAAYIYVNRMATVPNTVTTAPQSKSDAPVPDPVPAPEPVVYISGNDAMMMDAAYWTIEEMIAGKKIDGTPCEPDMFKLKRIQQSMIGNDQDIPGLQISDTRTVNAVPIAAKLVCAWHDLAASSPKHGDGYIRRAFNAVKLAGGSTNFISNFLAVRLGKELWPDSPPPKSPELAVTEGENEDSKGEQK